MARPGGLCTPLGHTARHLETVFVKNKIAQRALDYWEADRLLEVGILIFEHIPRKVRPLWSTEILKVSYELVSPSVEIEAVFELGNSDKWGEGKTGKHREARLLVAAVNDLHYQAEESLSRRVFALTKDVAKVVYNARWYPAPFDHSAGWNIATDLKKITAWVKDEEFAQRAWTALCNEDYLTLIEPTLCCPGCPICLSLLAQNPNPECMIARIGETHLSASDILKIGGFSS
jgi:hypothetical protein